MLIDKKFAVTAARVAFTTAILWAALGFDSLARPYQDNRRDFVVLVPFTLTAVVLWLFEPASILTGVALSPIAPLHDSGSYTGGIEKAVGVLILGLAIRKFSISHQPAATE